MQKLAMAAALVAALAAFPTSATTIVLESIGQVTPTDCEAPLPPQPLCADIAGGGIANDVPDVIPGNWIESLFGRVLFFSGTGSFDFDDASAADNDFGGTWTDVLGAPGPNGIANAEFHYVVTHGSGIFSGRTGSGVGQFLVAIAPSGFDANGAPMFTAPCAGAPAALGAYCERSQFDVAEPGVVGLALTAMLLAAVSA